MADAHYQRAQAELCLELASLLSDAEAVADLRAEAVQHLAHAARLEAQLGSTSSTEREAQRSRISQCLP
jgi:hypothetical protein